MEIIIKSNNKNYYLLFRHEESTKYHFHLKSGAMDRILKKLNINRNDFLQNIKNNFHGFENNKQNDPEIYFKNKNNAIQAKEWINSYLISYKLKEKA
jgi:6-phosphogluconate dehydrogenase